MKVITEQLATDGCSKGKGILHMSMVFLGYSQ